MIDYRPTQYSFGDNELPRQNINGRRHYMVNGVPLPSVTTVLNFKEKPEVAKWRARVGDEEAARISQQATFRGNEVHEIIETYIKTGIFDPKKYMPINVEMAVWIKDELDKNVTEVYASELKLYSMTLAVAGTVDCIGLWNGVPSIIDFKTSTRAKKDEWITGYYEQESCYSFMAFERSSEHKTPLFCKQLVTMIATEETKQCEVFVQKAAPWLDSAVKTISEYQEFIANGG